MNISSLNLASLNFNEINYDLKQYFKSEEKWQDYDFESDGFATTLFMDIQSAITYKMNVYLNASLNETFLSTCKTRDAAVRKAKMLDYRITSPNCSEAIIRMEFTPDGYPAQIIIPKYTKFTSSDSNGNIYNFLTNETYYCYPDVDSKYIIDITIYQADKLEYTWEVLNNQKTFLIPNSNVDTKKLIVQVKDSISETNWNDYYESINIIDNNSNSLVYFIQEDSNEHYEISFGDGIIGKPIQNGNVIKIQYFVTQGTNANGLTLFTLADTLDYSSTITTQQPSANGSDIESIYSIKRYAPLKRNSQGRAVNAEDFEVIIRENISQIASVSTWGGEENNPPLFGKVCISAITTSNYSLSDSIKTKIESLFNGNNIIGSKQLYWVDSQIINMIPSLQVYCDPNTNLLKSDLEIILRYGISIYNESINSFNYTFEVSTFIEYLKALNPAFLDIIMNSTLQYQTDNYNVSYLYIEFGNNISENTFISNKYYNSNNIICFLQDDGNGIINELTNQNGQNIINKAAVGTINYSTGYVAINDIQISALLGDTAFRCSVKPATNKIITKHNILLKIPYDLAVINITNS